jgi:hypothetical protein
MENLNNYRKVIIFVSSLNNKDYERKRKKLFE